MGLFGNIFKPLQGKLTAKQEENMKKVAEVFKEKTGKDHGCNGCVKRGSCTTQASHVDDLTDLENDNKEKTNENCSYILQLAYGLWHRR